MKRLSTQIIFGLLLIAAGVMFLLQNLGYLGNALAYFWAVAFVIGGGAFLYVYALDRPKQWWALIPGFALVGIGLLIGLSEIAPRWGDELGAPIFLALLSAGFWVVFFENREHWWALIPGGVILSLALFVGLEALFPGTDLVGVFFLGMGATFLGLSILPSADGSLRWALIPAGVLLLMGFIFLATALAVFRYLGPGVLVLAGIYLVVRNLSGFGRTA
jgi:hypothetical protein